VALLLSLLTAIVYGAGDFFGGLATKRSAVLTVVFASQVVGLGVLAIAAPVVGGTWHTSDVLIGAGAGLFGALAIALLYRALSIGAMGIVSPVTAVLAAALPAIYGLLAGERPPTAALAGIVLALVAVAVVSFVRAPGQTARGLPEAIVAGVLFALFFIAFSRTSPAAGLWPLAGARVASFVAFGLAGLVTRTSLVPRAEAWPTIAAAGVFDMLANVFYVLAVHTGFIAIVAVISSLYPASTLTLAAIFLRERLSRRQWVGVACAFAGIASIALAR
jgi:drug/metabolite transporter (DMT)-like permease